jgi:cytoskeletal protein CcmA (bactofilin family)
MDKSKLTGKQTLVEEGTELKGTLKSSCQVVVNGTIDGQITAPALTVSQSGMLLGTVKASSLRSEGTLAGDIDADDVYLSGTVRSNTVIRARKLEVKLAPDRGKLEVTFGECMIEVGDDPAHTAQEEPAPGAESKPPARGSEAPNWSEPAPSQAREGSEEKPEGGGRRKKNSDTRDSQTPPS